MHYFSFLKLVTICLFAVLAACEEQNPEHYIKEGELLFDQGELESARVQFQNAIQLDPELSTAYFQLALVAEKKQSWGRMLRNLLDTVRLDPTHLQAQIKLGQIYLLASEYDKAQQQAKIVLTLNPENITAQLMLAAVELKQGNKEQAIQQIDYVLGQQAYFAKAIALKVVYLNTENNPDEALAVLNEGIKHNPDVRDLRLLKIRLDMDSKRFDEAVIEYQNLIVKYPEEVNLRLPLAELLLTLDRQKEAEQLLAEVIEKQPKNIELKLKLVDLIQRYDVKQAELRLKEFITATPENAVLKFRLAEIYVSNDQLAQAEIVLQQIVSQSENSVDSLAARAKMAQIAIKQKDTTKVAQLADEILKIDENHSDALLLRAGLRLKRRDADGAISDLRIVLANRTDSEQAMVLYAKASIMKGEKEVAESQWRKILLLNPNNRLAITQLTNELQKRGDYVQAEELLLKAMETSVNVAGLVELQIQLKLAEKNWAGALKAIEKLATIPETEQSVNYWQGYIAALQGRTAEAIKKYKAILSVRPESVQALNGLVRLYETNERRSELKNYLKELLIKAPASQPALKILASIYAAEHNWQQAEETLQRVLQNSPDDTANMLALLDSVEPQSSSRAETMLKAWVQDHPEQLELKQRLADFYIHQKRYAESEQLLADITRLDLHSEAALLAQVKLAELAWKKHDAITALALLDKTINKSPWYNNALMMRASILFAQHNNDDAIADLKRVLENNSEYEPALLMMAKVYQRQGLLEKQQQIWRKVLENKPDHLAALKFLTAQFIKQKRWGQAENSLNKAAKVNGENTQITELIIQLQAAKQDWVAVEKAIARLQQQPNGELLSTIWTARIAEKQQKFDKAIALYQEILNKAPDNQHALMALGRVSQQDGKNAQLIIYLNSLLHNNPEVDALYHTLALAYSTNKQWPEAERVLQQQIKRAGKDINAYILLARLYQSQNKQLEAEKTYISGLAAIGDHLQLLNELAKFYIFQKEYIKSIKVYDKIIELYPDNNEAANNLADLLVTHQGDDEQTIKRALQLVQRFQYSSNPVTLDTYGWVQLKSGNSKVALEALKKSVKAVPEDARVLYHLAKTYQQLGDVNNALIALEKSLSLIKKQGEFAEIANARALKQQLRE
mgnify:FL=1